MGQKRFRGSVPKYTGGLGDGNIIQHDETQDDVLPKAVYTRKQHPNNNQQQQQQQQQQLHRDQHNQQQQQQQQQQRNNLNNRHFHVRQSPVYPNSGDEVSSGGRGGGVTNQHQRSHHHHNDNNNLRFDGVNPAAYLVAATFVVIVSGIFLHLIAAGNGETMNRKHRHNRSKHHNSNNILDHHPEYDRRSSKVRKKKTDEWNEDDHLLLHDEVDLLTESVRAGKSIPRATNNNNATTLINHVNSSANSSTDGIVVDGTSAGASSSIRPQIYYPYQPRLQQHRHRKPTATTATTSSSVRDTVVGTTTTTTTQQMPSTTATTTQQQQQPQHHHHRSYYLNQSGTAVIAGSTLMNNNTNTAITPNRTPIMNRMYAGNNNKPPPSPPVPAGQTNYLNNNNSNEIIMNQQQQRNVIRPISTTASSFESLTRQASSQDTDNMSYASHNKNNSDNNTDTLLGSFNSPMNAGNNMNIPSQFTPQQQQQQQQLLSRKSTATSSSDSYYPNRSPSLLIPNDLSTISDNANSQEQGTPKMSKPSSLRLRHQPMVDVFAETPRVANNGRQIVPQLQQLPEHSPIPPHGTIIMKSSSTTAAAAASKKFGSNNNNKNNSGNNNNQGLLLDAAIAAGNNNNNFANNRLATATTTKQQQTSSNNNNNKSQYPNSSSGWSAEMLFASPPRIIQQHKQDNDDDDDDDLPIPFVPSLEVQISKQRPPKSMNLDELHLFHIMESGDVSHWEERVAEESRQLKKRVFPHEESANIRDSVLAANVNSQDSDTSITEESIPSDDPRKGIHHKRKDLTLATDAAASLQGAIDFNELKLVDVIGGGGFGQVWKAMWRGTPVAVKVLTGSAQSKAVPRAVLEEFAAEINLLKGMRHPNICLYMGACLEPPNRAIITELAANGSLWDALRLPLTPPYVPCDGFSRDGWPEALYQPDSRHGAPPASFRTPATSSIPPRGTWHWILVKRVACGAARGMAYLHSGKPPILHRDLKSANILLDDSYTAKVCDFGLSRLKAQERSMTGNCGTVQWMAPEVLANQSYNEKADVFSYGIICWELLTRQCPYDKMSPIQCALAVLNRNQRPEIPRWCPPSLQALIRSCLKKDPDERPTFPQILQALDVMP